jgi:hypothetical protein
MLKKADALPIGIALVILAVTLRPGGGGSGSTVCLICGERGLADFLANIILFAPFGAAVAWRTRRGWLAPMLGGLLSLGIEALQWQLIPARDASLGDFVANCLGAAVGAFLVYARPWRPLRHGAVVRSSVIAALTIATLVSALTLFTISYDRTQYWLHWVPRYRNLAQYHGEVVDTRIGALAWFGSQKMEDVDSIRKVLATQPIEFRFVAGPPSRTLAPIVSISDQNDDEVILIGAERSDLVYRFRARANDFRLDHDNVRFAAALQNVREGDTVAVAAFLRRKEQCVSVNGQPTCNHGFTVGDTWSLLVGLNAGRAATVLLSIVWMFVVFVPTGFVTHNLRAFAATMAGSLIALLVLPLAFGFAMTPWYQLVAALGGAWTGRWSALRFAPATVELRSPVSRRVTCTQ